MKKSLLVLVGILVFVCGSAFAQDYPKAEVFGGFSVLSLGADDELFGEREQFMGFQANAAFNATGSFGIVADFGGQYKSFSFGEDGDISAHIYEYLFGPRFSMRGEKVTVFGQALFGGASIGAEGESLSGLAMGFGGGIDVNVNDRFAVRVVQFDWIPTRFEGVWFNNQMRFGFGIVIK